MEAGTIAAPKRLSMTDQAHNEPNHDLRSWATSLALVAALLVFLIVTFFVRPNLTDDQRSILRFLIALLAGLAAYFIGGTALFELRGDVNPRVGFTLKAAGGLAIFAFVFWVTPGTVLQGAPAQEILYRAPLAQWGPESDDCGGAQPTSSGAYELVVKCNGVMKSHLAPNEFRDFDLTMPMEKISGSDKPWYGVVIVDRNQDGGSTQHRFLVSGNGNYTSDILDVTADAHPSGPLRVIVPFVNSPAITTANAQNELRVVRKGATAEMWVNTKRLFTVPISVAADKPVRVGPAIGLSPDEPTMLDVWVKEFTVRQPL
jgi:hypothetical protein